MSAPNPHATSHEAEVDTVASIVPMIPYIIPIAGGVLIFLLAFIAVSMA